MAIHNTKHKQCKICKQNLIRINSGDRWIGYVWVCPNEEHRGPRVKAMLEPKEDV